MNRSSRRIRESPIYQGVDERIAYTLTTTPFASSPSSPVMTIKDIDGEDVTSDYISGSASVSGDVITTPIIISLTAGVQYRMEIQFVSSGNTWEAWCDLRGEV